MTYVVTTKSRYCGANDLGYLATLSRHEVATLEEARDAARAIFNAPDETQSEAFERAWAATWDIPEQGGTVGPLPDGTVIEVERQ